ncbi:MAG TPA: hypothetical protein VK488_04665 [Gaiellaceae bacterium]|nr:hypothetical protein [Gaiellaceae bacterium]
MGWFLLAETATFLVAFVLTVFFGGKKILALGAVVVFVLPMTAAVWDPDGSCVEQPSESGGFGPDFGSCDFLFGNLSPGEWFMLSLIGAGVLYLGWAVGVGVAVQARRSHNSRSEDSGQ